MKSLLLGVAIFITGALGYFLGIDSRAIASVFIFAMFYIGYRHAKKEHPDRKYEPLMLLVVGVFAASACWLASM